MAKAQLSPFVTALSGSIGGLTARQQRATTCLASRYNTRRHRRPSQSAATANLSNCIALWRSSLSASQRCDWQSLAQALHAPALGPTQSTLDGRTLFLSENLQRLAFAVAPMIDAPSPPARLPPPLAAVSMPTSSTIQLADAGDLPSAGEAFGVTLSRAFPLSQRNPRTWSRQHWTLSGPLVATQTLAVDPPYCSGLYVLVGVRRFGHRIFGTEHAVLIADQTLTSNTLFSPIDVPQLYDHLSIIVAARSVSAVAADYLYLYFNNDTTLAHYIAARHTAGVTHAAASTQVPILLWLPTTAAPANAISHGVASIPFYRGPVWKSCLCFNDSPDSATLQSNRTYSLQWMNAAAVSRLSFGQQNPGATLLSGSRIQVYGHAGALSTLSGLVSSPAFTSILWPGP